MKKAKSALTLRVALSQINCTVGDLEGNAGKIKAMLKQAGDRETELVVFPELAICGYPPEDLLLKPKFIQDNLRKIQELAGSVRGPAAIVGFVDKKGKDIYNAAALIYDGKVRGVYHKMLLPNYGVFDEKRYFKPGEKPGVFKLGSQALLGLSICEDIWYEEGPVKREARSGCRLIININASPYHLGKIKEREAMVRSRAKANKVFIAYLNLVGGQDELVFDGRSMVVDDKGKVIARAEAFKEDLLIVDLPVEGWERQDKPRRPLPRKEVQPLAPEAEVYQALILGLRDYTGKNGFEKVVLGLSGGIDSALVAALAVDAMGKDNVTGVFMPSRYSSAGSEEDTRELARLLGIKLIVFSIEPLYKMYLATLEPFFAGASRNIAEENIQARVRGNILMAFSNKFNWLVLATGNKSEMSTGYATLYGDMAGGFALIKDVPKTLVYQLSRYRNSLAAQIPENILNKAPTAELKPNQKDSDTLPVYEKLDPILKAYIEEDQALEKIAARGFDQEVVLKVLAMVDKSEYKRRQSPPGIKITPKSFGRDRRMPITNKYRG